MNSLTLIVAAVSFLLSPISSFSQEASQPKAWLIRHPFAGGDVVHYTQEVALIFGDYKNDPNVRAAIRVCSKDPLPLALNTASASPFLMEQYLTEFYGYARERILFLRSEDCLGAMPAPGITESWLVPKGAAVPPSVELVRSCQVNSVSIPKVTKSNEIINRQEYMAALREFVEELKSNPDAVGIILGGYFVEAGERLGRAKYDRPRAIMKQRVREANNFLKKEKLQQDRYFVRVHPRVTTCANGCVYSEQPRFPVLRVIEITKECSSNN